MLGKLIALVLPLGLDTFAVAAALGAVEAAPVGAGRRRLRIALLLTAFEGGMPLVGLAAGAPLGHAIGGAAEYAAIGVLFAFGLYALLGAEEDGARVGHLAELRGFGAVLLGLSVSLDELAIGFTLGLLRLPVGLAVLLIAVQAFVLAQLGLRIGARIGERTREGAERLAGVALVGLGAVLLAEKLLG